MPPTTRITMNAVARARMMAEINNLKASVAAPQQVPINDRDIALGKRLFRLTAG